MYKLTLARTSVSSSLNDTAANTKEQTGGRKRVGYRDVVGWWVLLKRTERANL